MDGCISKETKNVESGNEIANHETISMESRGE